jgi:group I intron endonuclease
MGSTVSGLNGVSGVYLITNRETGRAYIGASVDIGKRWVRHGQMLRNGKHENAAMVADARRDGWDAFLISLLEEAPADQLATREAVWLQRFSRHAPGLYNIRGCATGEPRRNDSGVTPEDIKAIRAKHGWSQGQLARHLGINRVTVNQWENGARRVPPLARAALAALAG